MAIFFLIVEYGYADDVTDKEKKLSQEEAHQFFAVDLFNKTWDLLVKTDRTEIEDNRMLWQAYASLYHWSVIGKPINIQRGEWMVSHVNAVLYHPEAAVYHAERCWHFTEELALVDFDKAYSLEALARAYACAGDTEKAKEYYAKAREAGAKIEGQEDYKLFMSDLETGPWFGMIE